ncbi:MAG TPA: general secretion pathway protein GspG, partial [Nitrospirae bacterium]|nr:general secretion pathway protein GspG [Nitrospirota bacterium]
MDPWGNRYVYLLTGNGYRLFSAGPDGKPDTGDDIF